MRRRPKKLDGATDSIWAGPLSYARKPVSPYRRSSTVSGSPLSQASSSFLTTYNSGCYGVPNTLVSRMLHSTFEGCSSGYLSLAPFTVRVLPGSRQILQSHEIDFIRRDSQVQSCNAHRELKSARPGAARVHIRHTIPR